MLRAHRQAWAWQDEWMGLTMDDIRKLEDETQKILQRKLGRLVPEDEEKEVEFILKEEEDVTEVSRGFNVRGAESLGGALHKRNSKKLVYVLYSNLILLFFLLPLSVYSLIYMPPGSSSLLPLSVYIPPGSSPLLPLSVYFLLYIPPGSSPLLPLSVCFLVLLDPSLFFLSLYIS